MKRLVMFFLCYPAWLHGQLCFDFEDNSLVNWYQGRDSAWDIESDGAVSGIYSLHHYMDDSVGNNDRIAFPLDSLVLGASNTSWKFRIKHGYNPSSANNWAVFLAADGNQQNMSPNGDINAYILGVNFSGSDDTLKLWKRESGNTSILLKTNLNWQDKIGHATAYLNIQRGENGKWQVFMEKDAAGTWEPIGEGLDTGLISPDYFGIYYRYSSKQDRRLWFDDLCISGLFIQDTIPPSITLSEVIDQNTIQLSFNEFLNEASSLVPENFLLSPVGKVPESIIRISGKTCQVVFSDPFPGEMPLALSIFNMEDRKGNTAGLLKMDFLFYYHGVNDIVFNEIMFDPAPAMGLPEFEYLELYNRTRYDINLDAWTLQSGQKKINFPRILLPGGKYLLLGYEGSDDQYSSADTYLGLLTSRASLPNEGTLLCLYDQDSLLIDWVEYDPSMHEHDYYTNGGWALEKVDPDRRCGSLDNWSTSKNKSGGTPGLENSVKQGNPDLLSPAVVNLYLPDSLALVIEFSEGMDPVPLHDPHNYFINRGHGYPKHIECLSPFNRKVTLLFDKTFDPGKDYQLEISGDLTDCAGLSLTSDRILRFALPANPGINEVLISEILFNPQPFCPDFIEIHNPGLKTFDLSDLRIGKRNTETSEIEFVSPLTPGHRLFFPGDYIALTEDPEKLAGCCYVHDLETLIRCKGLPSMNDREGTMLILDKYLQVLDEISYDQKMHFSLLYSVEGVSLERLSFDLPSENSSNWHSAAATEGYSTPGRENSQSRQTRIEYEGIEIEPEVFTPDQDGNNDMLMIKYSFSQPGVLATILVLDPRGRMIKKIAENQLLGLEGFYTWDGTDHHGHRARAGLYLIFARIINLHGGVKQYKKTCVLSPGSVH